MTIKGYIYCATCLLNGKSYFGQTVKSVEKIYKQHLRTAQRGENTKLYRAIRKYGSKNFTIEEVISVEASSLQALKAKLDFLERHFIQKYDTRRNGYNMTDGGEGTLGDGHTIIMTKKKGAGTNSKLRKAAKVKNDEFYTRLTDIENELFHYKDHFKNKIIYCNCDDPYRSNFVKYFALNFKFLGLKQLVATCYKHPDTDDSQFEKVVDRPIKWVYNGEQIEGQNHPDLSKAIVTNLEGDGDFRSEECLDILKDCDIVVTNPPFSLFREFVNTLVDFEKKFLIIGSKNAIAYKEVFPLLKDDIAWLGYSVLSGSMYFVQEDLTEKGIPSFWYTNLEHDKINEEIRLFKKYNEIEYPTYDNYNAINVDRVKDIPCDYKGIMGVPITFMTKYNPKQFEILNADDFIIDNRVPKKKHGLIKDSAGRINGKSKYARIVIRNRKPQLD